MSREAWGEIAEQADFTHKTVVFDRRLCWDGIDAISRGRQLALERAGRDAPLGLSQEETIRELGYALESPRMVLWRLAKVSANEPRDGSLRRRFIEFARAYLWSLLGPDLLEGIASVLRCTQGEDEWSELIQCAWRCADVRAGVASPSFDPDSFPWPAEVEEVRLFLDRLGTNGPGRDPAQTVANALY